MELASERVQRLQQKAQKDTEALDGADDRSSSDHGHQNEDAVSRVVFTMSLNAYGCMGVMGRSDVPPTISHG